MSTENSTQSHNPFSFFTRIMDGQVDRVDAWLEQMQEWQHKGFDRTEEAIDEAADLSKTTLRYVQRLTDEWQEMSTETMRQMTDRVNADE